MSEYNYFELNEFSWDLLNNLIKHGHGDVELCYTTFFLLNLSEETASLTLKEFYDKAVNHNGELWKGIKPIEGGIK